MTATSHAGVGAVFAARLSPPPPGAASAVHGDLFFLLGSFLKTKLYCWRPQKGGSPSFTLTNAWPKITSLREPCCWRPYTGARRAHGEDARAAAGFKAPLPCDAAALLPASFCVCVGCGEVHAAAPALRAERNLAQVPCRLTWSIGVSPNLQP